MSSARSESPRTASVKRAAFSFLASTCSRVSRFTLPVLKQSRPAGQTEHSGGVLLPGYKYPGVYFSGQHCGGRSGVLDGALRKRIFLSGGGGPKAPKNSENCVSVFFRVVFVYRNIIQYLYCTLPARPGRRPPRGC